MKRLLINVAVLILFGFASISQAKQGALLLKFNIGQTQAVDTQSDLSSTNGAASKRAVEGSVEKTSELKKNKVLDGTAVANDQQELIAQATLRVKQFSTQLKAELIAAIQSGGLDAGVEICHSKAPKIADNLSTEGWTVARTSLKTRNENNKPDIWETDTLNEFNTRLKQGEKAANLVTTLSDKKHFRLMKAIPMDQVCLACHGSSIDAGLQNTIQKYYPNDNATGFSLEDIRGAFTLQKDLSE